MLLLAAAKTDILLIASSPAWQKSESDIAAAGHEKRSVRSGETDSASASATETATVSMTGDKEMQPR